MLAPVSVASPIVSCDPPLSGGIDARVQWNALVGHMAREFFDGCNGGRAESDQFLPDVVIRLPRRFQMMGELLVKLLASAIPVEERDHGRPAVIHPLSERCEPFTAMKLDDRSLQPQRAKCRRISGAFNDDGEVSVQKNQFVDESLESCGAESFTRGCGIRTGRAGQVNERSLNRHGSIVAGVPDTCQAKMEKMMKPLCETTADHGGRR